eukprot:5884424-Amphidinium_carterae.1
MVAEQGVPLGVDCTLPRVRKIFGGKKTWSVQQETGELGGGDFNGNYKSVEKEMEKVRAQVADMKAGFVRRVDNAVAGRVLGGDP